ncbi:MAG: methyltransferase domain-containing protein [Henriciella sp.]|uniref:class I SAM-dependent methyltransferase n=1 Tax=Henriciella sp. TaxID=1968823 RepID=UPI0032ECE58A
MTRSILTGAASLLILAACASHTDSDLPPAEAPPPPAFAESAADEAAINAAIVSPARPETDVERDELRKPGAVIEFMQLQPGETVLEMEAGSGYFTEIFSQYLGDKGMLYMQNPAAFDAFLGETAVDRAARLDNVEYIKSDFDEIPLEDASVDVVTWFQGPHELWYTPEGGGKLVGNAEASFPELMRVLKPGGQLVIIDHTAPAGTPESSGGDTHRIDPQIIRDMASDAGFVLIAESDLYDNPDDDLDASVFDEKVRGMTDQFLMKFEKPAARPE